MNKYVLALFIISMFFSSLIMFVSGMFMKQNLSEGNLITLLLLASSINLIINGIILFLYGRKVKRNK